MQKTVTVPIEIDAVNFITQLADELSYDEAIEIIKIIDDRMANWEFTKQVAAHFISEIVKGWGEMGEPFEKSPIFSLSDFIKEHKR